MSSLSCLCPQRKEFYEVNLSQVAFDNLQRLKSWNFEHWDLRSPHLNTANFCDTVEFFDDSTKMAVWYLCIRSTSIVLKQYSICQPLGLSSWNHLFQAGLYWTKPDNIHNFRKFCSVGFIILSSCWDEIVQKYTHFRSQGANFQNSTAAKRKDNWSSDSHTNSVHIWTTWMLEMVSYTDVNAITTQML